MKSTTLAFCLTSALLAASASAYEVPTHIEITERAVRRSTLNDRIRDLGASVGLLTVDSRILGDLLGVTVNEPAVSWIRYGSAMEDSFYGFRFRKHFYNPIAPPGQEGYSYGIFSGAPSLEWGLEPEENSSQEFSYHDAKEYMYQGVLAPTEEERKRNLSLLLRTTGHVLHLLQDLAQPQHTRNDSHITGSAYEAWVNELLPAVPFGNYPVVHLDTPDSYWIAADGSGLANYTNRGFITAGTNFTGDRVGNDVFVRPNPLFPSPGGPGTTARRMQITDLLGPVGPGQPVSGEIWFVENPVTDSLTGETVPNSRASTFSIFDEDLVDRGGTGTFTVNRFTYRSAMEFLIPRAVAYSAGMIDHIFRGKLTIGLPEIGAYAVADHGSAVGFQELKATVTNATPGEEMWGGSLVAVAKYHRNGCYQPDLTGEFTEGADGRPVPPEGCLQYRSQEEFRSVAAEQTVTLESGGQVELTFSFEPPIPMDATDLYLQVVYRGPLWSEQTGRMELDGIAVGLKDISEPTYLTVFNATDVYVLPSAAGPQFHYYQNIIDPNHISEYPLVDRNENGEYDPPEDLEIRGGDVRYDIYLSGGRIATVPALPEGRFFRLAMLVDPHPQLFRFWITAQGNRYNRMDIYDAPPKMAQLDHEARRYYVSTNFFDLRETRQSLSLLYFHRLVEGADVDFMPISLAQDSVTPFPVSVMPGEGLRAQELEPPATSSAADGPVPINFHPQ